MSDSIAGSSRLRLLSVVAVAGLALCGFSCERARRITPIVRVGVPSLFGMPGRPVCEGTADTAIDVAAVDADLREVSGIAASQANTGLVWMLKDAGNAAEVSGVSADDGSTRIVVGLPVDNIDFEDVAVGPCPDLSSPCVFVADTGDNDATRAVIFIYAFPEPELATLKPDDGTGIARVDLTAVWTMPLIYPDNIRPDVEAIAVLPDATALILFEKAEAASARIFTYRAPWTTLTPLDGADDNDAARVVELTGSITVPASVGNDEDRRITGASMHWSGTRLLIRTTGALLEYAATDPASFFDLLGRAPRQQVVSPAGEEQGEAITHDDAGTGWLSISEVKTKKAKAGETPVLHKIPCVVGN